MATVYDVAGDSGSVYQVKDHGDHWSCSCPSWRFMGGSVKDRYCKHINRLIGTSVPITPRKAATKRKSPDTPPAMAAKAPPVALAKEWHGQDPSGMLMSEKLDGMRCFWDGKNADRRNPLPTGTVITYKFQELTNDGLPRFPVFMRVRQTE